MKSAETSSRAATKRGSLSIRAKLYGLLALFAVALLALTGLNAWRMVEGAYAQRQEELRHLVDLAYSGLESAYADYKSGAATQAQAQAQAKAILRRLRYAGSGYFSAFDEHDVILVHGVRPDQEGVAGDGVKDPSGKFYVKEMLDAARAQGGAFENYAYAKPGVALDHPTPKLAYARYFAPWRWSLSTGVYLDDLSSAIWSQVAYGLAASLAFLIVAGAIGGLVVRGLSRRLNTLETAMSALAAGDAAAELPPVRGDDEVDRMSAAVHVFQDAARAKATLEREAQNARVQAEAGRTAFDHERADKEARIAQATTALGVGLERLAAGDLAHRIDAPFAAGLDKLRLDFNAALEKLRETMQAVREKSDGLHSVVGEISHASQELSSRTETQAASLNETASAVATIATTLRTAADGAKNASRLVVVADEEAHGGAVVVGKAIEAMGAISGSSQQIAQIIGVIDEIAFQTNLLALNAGVEAARAGDAGRGFAVVASEVRALAQRSADAAKEIKTLISASAAQVETGVRLVTDTGGSLARIIERVSEIRDVVVDIATKAEQQAKGIGKVDAAVGEMDRATQQNASMAEEASAASLQLTGDTEQLADLIRRFNLVSPGSTASGRGHARAA